jgi:hypothetical protein
MRKARAQHTTHHTHIKEEKFMIKKILYNQKIKTKTKGYISILSDLLEFRDYLTEELSLNELNSEEQQELLQTKHNILMTIRNIVSVGKVNGVFIASLYWNGTEIDI